MRQSHSRVLATVRTFAHIGFLSVMLLAMGACVADVAPAGDEVKDLDTDGPCDYLGVGYKACRARRSDGSVATWCCDLFAECGWDPQQEDADSGWCEE